MRSPQLSPGPDQARQIHGSFIPKDDEEMFCRRPSFSTQTREQRVRMKQIRIAFLRDDPEALERWNAGEHDVVFPSDTVRMRLRHDALMEPVPLDMSLAA